MATSLIDEIIVSTGYKIVSKNIEQARRIKERKKINSHIHPDTEVEKNGLQWEYVSLRGHSETENLIGLLGIKFRSFGRWDILNHTLEVV